MMALLELVIYGIIFYFITVWFTQDHNLNWVRVMLWTAFVHALGMGVAVLGMMLGDNEIAPAVMIFGSISVLVVGLYLVLDLALGVKSIAKRLQIAGVYLVAIIGINLVC